MEFWDGVLHIRDLQGPKNEGDEKARLADVEKELFNYNRIVKHGLDANHSMIKDSMPRDFTSAAVSTVRVQ
ncbi:hypothetical protein D1007_43705 [Hordeum vulgare]|nr:hypothetical protein D1007_43705 [Hordeum vulgare]